MTKFLTILAAACWLAGCAKPVPPVSLHPAAAGDYFPDFGAGQCRPDAAAPDWMTQKAKAFHQTGKRASRYPYFAFCQRRLEGPGYEAKFTKPPDNRPNYKGIVVNVTYYFDEQGRYITTRGVGCIY